MIGHVLRLIGANAAFLAAGVGASRALGCWGTWADLRRRLGVAYLAGVASIGLICSVLATLGSAIPLWLILIVAAALAGMAALPARGRAAVPGRLALEPGDLRLVAPPVIAAIVVLAGLAVALTFEPLSSFDGWALWTSKARSILLLHGLNAHFLAGSGLNPDYPPLWPVVEAIDFRFMSVDTQVIHLQYWFLLVGTIWAAVDLLADQVRPVLLWTAAAALAVAPSVTIQAAFAGADLPLACFFAVAGLCVWRLIRLQDHALLPVFVLFSAAALLTKVEAFLYVAALDLVALMLLRRSHALALRFAVASLLSAVPLVLWHVWTRAHDVHSLYTSSNARSVSFLVNHISRVPVAAGKLAHELLTPTSWLMIVPLAAVAGLIALLDDRGADAALLIAPPLLAVLGLVAVYWATPFPFDWHLSTSAPRVVTPAVFYCATLAPAVVAGRGARARATPRDPARRSGAGR